MTRTLATSVSHLTAHLGYWLRYVSNHVSHAFARKLEAQGVTVAEWALMRELFGVTSVAPSGVAEKLGLTRGAITKLADRLIEKGLATRTRNVKDARGQSLALTASARRLIPKLAALADQNDAEFFSHLSLEDRKTIERVLKETVKVRGLKSTPVS
jgi:DNA-binding MarR family transcriptional regulator